MFPQRQRFPRFGAVAVVRFPVTPSSRCSKAVLRSGGIPQRQRFPRFGAVAVIRFPVTPSSRYSKAASRSGGIPQRQRFLRFGAGVVVRFPVTPVFTVLQGGLTVRQVSTTAAFSAIRCRCGRKFPCHPVFTVLQGGFTVWQVSTTAAFPAIRCRCGSTFPCHPRLHGAPRRFYGQAGFHNGSVFRDSVPLWHTVVRRARLRRSHFAMSNMLPKFISFIIKDIRFNNLPDPADIAAKRPFSPISSQVQHVSFFRVSDYQVFL